MPKYRVRVHVQVSSEEGYSEKIIIDSDNAQSIGGDRDEITRELRRMADVSLESAVINTKNYISKLEDAEAAKRRAEEKEKAENA
jgi:hypothetical protein